MSFHKNPKYQIPELIESLKSHGLEHDTPSQLSDAFRTGWVAALAAQAPAMALVPQPITEEMHIAAVKVLHRAHGLDGLPQRMLDAMIAAAPATAGEATAAQGDKS